MIRPFSMTPPDGELPILSKTQVQVSLSNRFRDLKIEISKETLAEKFSFEATDHN